MQALPGCVVEIAATERGTVTDNFGKFNLTVTKNSRLIISFVGYESDTLVIEDVKRPYEVLLTPNHQILAEVVVTAMSRATLMKENPIAISAVSSASIDRAVENNIIDALAKNTPGLSALKTGPNISKPFIRGMGFNRVLTLYDGVRQEGQQWGGEHGLEVDNYNIDRAEIVKGPASLVYGSDAMAGVVSMFPYIPKSSDGKVSGRWLTEFQGNNGLVGNGFRVGAGATHWLWMVRGSYRIAKNYQNKIDGRVFNTGFQEKNVSAMAGYKSAAGFTHINLSLYDNLQGIPDGSRDSLTRKFTKQIDEGDLDDIKHRPIVSPSELNSYRLSPLHQRIQHYRLYANSHYHFDPGDVNILLAWTQNIRREFNHPTAPEQAGTYLRLNTFNYSVRFNLREFFHIETTVGVNGMRQKNSNRDASNFPVPDYLLNDFGAFGLATWHGGKWTLAGGARFDARNIQTYDFYAAADPLTGFFKQVSPPDTAGAALQFPATRESFRGVSLSFGVTRQLGEHLRAKVNLSRGYRAPSISEIAANGLDAGAHIVYIGNTHFVPEFSWQQDAGLFADFAGLSASISLFNKNIQHYIFLNQVLNTQGQPVTDAQGNKTFQYQQSTAQLYGLEGTLNWQPRWVKGLDFANQLALCYGFNRNPLFAHTGTEGEYLPFIPPARWVSGVSQKISLKSSWLSGVHVTAEMDVNAAQRRYQGLYDTETMTPGYTLVNLGAGATLRQSARSAWQVQAQVNNVFDVAYQSNMSRLKYFEYYQQTPNGRSGIYSMGRNVSIKIIFSF